VNYDEALDYYTDQSGYSEVLGDDDLGRGEAMEAAFRAAWGLAKADGPRSPRSLVDLARVLDEEEDPVKRSLARIQLVKAILEGDINDGTSVIGMGPVSLDVNMARSHRWSKEQIDRAWSVLEAVASAEGEIASAGRTAMDDCSVCGGDLDVVGVYRQSDGEGGMKHSREEDCEVEG
jgi:hypothetical protein